MGKQQKLFGPELIKFIATLMITNSHLKDFYIDPYKPLGTFGAPGNALFSLYLVLPLLWAVWGIFYHGLNDVYHAYFLLCW